jgi:hypothetical protein
MRRAFLIVTVNWKPPGVWKRATAARMVREAGVPPRVAAEWQRIRREMSPKGLERKMREQMS